MACGSALLAVLQMAVPIANLPRMSSTHAGARFATAMCFHKDERPNTTLVIHATSNSLSLVPIKPSAKFPMPPILALD